MIVLNNTVSYESWSGVLRRGGAGSEGGGNMQEGLDEAGSSQDHPGMLVWTDNRHLGHTLACPSESGGFQRSGQVGVGWPSEKRWPEGNSLAEGGAVENGNIPKF